MAAAVHYTHVGIRTRDEAYWSMAIVAVSMIGMVILEFLRTGDGLRLALAVFWVVMFALGTIRSLRRLGELEKTCREPTEAMKLAFELTLLLPIAAMIPLMI